MYYCPSQVNGFCVSVKETACMLHRNDEHSINGNLSETSCRETLTCRSHGTILGTIAKLSLLALLMGCSYKTRVLTRCCTILIHYRHFSFTVHDSYID